MEPTLPTLATELVELIASWLEPTDLCSLRLVCKNLRQKSIRVFGACFTTVRTDLSQKSLQKLQEISENENLRLYVQTLLIKGNKRKGLGRGFQWHRPFSGHLEALLPGLEMLQYLLAHKLPNCRSFHIYDQDWPRKFVYDPFIPSDVVGLILRVVPSLGVDASKSPPVKSFIVDFSSPCVDVTPSCTGSVDANRLHMWQYRQPSFRKAWAHIQEIVLCLAMKPDTLDWGIDLITDATCLRKLSVTVGYSESFPFLERLCELTSLDGLESFKLAEAYTSVEILSRLIDRWYDTLRELSLSKICLQRPTDWLIVLARLGNQAPFLHSLSIYSLTTSEYESDRTMTFVSLEIDPVVPDSGGRKFTLIKDRVWREITGVQYQGPRVDMALDKLLKALQYCRETEI